MKKSIHILGICGTFMGSVARIATQLGFAVQGSDQHVYPPMSDQLKALGMHLFEGYQPDDLKGCDEVMVGNAMSRGNACVESVLDQRLPYSSAPEWLYRHVLSKRSVLAVAGTHGKTTTTSILSWILRQSGDDCGYLIGGVANGFDYSADLGTSEHFVIEADEYDSAFYDKRSKFLHYHPKILIINNLEFDHADIFSSLDDIKKQFQILLREVPQSGLVIYPAGDANVVDVVNKESHSRVLSFGSKQGAWQYQLDQHDASAFSFYHEGKCVARVSWSMKGEHNVANALAAFLAARESGVAVEPIVNALQSFPGVKRRLELISDHNGVKVYDDFAHHPTAIATTLNGLKASLESHSRLIAILQLASFTMRAGVHKDTLKTAFETADEVYILRPNPDWGVDDLADERVHICDGVSEIVSAVKPHLQSGDNVVIMSNRGFDGIYAHFK